MKRLLGAMLGAMMLAFSVPATAPADAQVYRDHEGWYGAQAAPVQVAAASRQGSILQRAVTASRAHWRGRRVRRWSRYYAPAMRSTRAYRRVWFGNKIVWWPVTTSAPVMRRRSSYRYASWRPYSRSSASRWSRGHRVYWHPGYWTTAGGNGAPGTWTPEPVYRYNPNGQNPQVMDGAPAAAPARTRAKKGARTYNGYQYYYYGKPTSAAPTTTRLGTRTTRRSAAAAMSVPHDNIPTVYLYQRGHRQGIHLPAAEAPKPAAAPGAGVAPGQPIAPGAPGVPGAPGAAPGGPLIPGAAPAAPVPAAPVVPAPGSP